jgi:Ser/Thr protein kinase RdoA (MazF antagonist)
VTTEGAAQPAAYGEAYGLDELEQSLAGARILAVGVLNTAYEATLRGERVFVRRRTLFGAGDYAQTFAGERFLPPSVRRQLCVPHLRDVVADRAGRDVFAVFDFVPGAPPSWCTSVCRHLAAALAVIHAHRHPFPGPIDATHDPGVPPCEFIRALFEVEFDRLAAAERSANALVSACRAALRHLPAYTAADLTLCHGDVRRANLLEDAEGRLWMLDWEAARFRVPACDFNQLTFEWLSEAQLEELTACYCGLRNVNPDQLRVEVGLFRILWHVRTFNFETTVLRRDGATLQHHLAEAARLSASYA